MELIAKLGIDLKLLLAQIVNFSILLFVLFKFVYHPVFNLLEKRRKMIEKQVDDAKKAEELLADIETTRQESLTKIKTQSVEMLEEASKKAEKVKEELLASARDQAQSIIETAKGQIQEEKKRMLKEAEQQLADMIVTVTSRILDREFSDADHDRLMESAVSQISKN